MNLLKTLGDMVTAGQALGIPKKLLGFDFNDGHVGLGGLTSAAITCYQLFPSAPGKKWTTKQLNYHNSFILIYINQLFY